MKKSDPYLTWLDFWVAEAAQKVGRLPTGKAPASDLEAAWWMALSALSQTAPRLARGDLSAEDVAQACFFGAILSFCNPHRKGQPRAFEALYPAGVGSEGMHHGRGLKLSSRLVSALANARAPQTPDWMDLARASAWYFDLPQGALWIGDCTIRAIFTQPDPHGGVAAVAILTEPGSEVMVGRYSWMLVGRQEDAPLGSHAGRDLDADALRERVNDFVILSLLYFKSLEQTTRLPQRTPTGERLSAVQRKFARKTASLFVVHVLPEPPGHFGRSESALQGAWRLDHRVSVRGHFRWQPHGPELSLRKLIFIAEHVRGADLPDKPELIPLHRSHPPNPESS